MKIAVITGASSGMGREFVYALDKDEKFDELWVIARREHRLEELKSKCRAKVRPIVLDLQLRESFKVYRSLLEEHKPEISVLSPLSILAKSYLAANAKHQNHLKFKAQEFFEFSRGRIFRKTRLKFEII